MSKKQDLPENIQEKNKSLEQLSPLVLGPDCFFEIVDPRGLVLLKDNARYFKKSTFRQLVENLKNDQRLSSTPLCRQLPDGNKEVLSGNHRVSAAIQAGLQFIMVIVIHRELAEAEKIAVQLSHNAIVGEDDPERLKELWSRIDDIKARLYAGLSSDTLKELEKVKLTTFSTPQVYTKTLSFTFTAAEKENFDAIVAELEKLPKAERYLVDLDLFDEFFELIRQTKKIENIKNGSLAMLHLIELAKTALEEKQSE